MDFDFNLLGSVWSLDPLEEREGRQGVKEINVAFEIWGKGSKEVKKTNILLKN